MPGRRTGIRTVIRNSVACPSCKAEKGQPCVAYTNRNNGVKGTPLVDVHAARWQAWRYAA